MADLANISDAVASQFRGLNARNPGQWPLIPRVFAALGVMLAVIALGWFMYWDGQLTELESG